MEIHAKQGSLKSESQCLLHWQHFLLALCPLKPSRERPWCLLHSDLPSPPPLFRSSCRISLQSLVRFVCCCCCQQSVVVKLDVPSTYLINASASDIFSSISATPLAGNKESFSNYGDGYSRKRVVLQRMTPHTIPERSYCTSADAMSMSLKPSAIASSLCLISRASR